MNRQEEMFFTALSKDRADSADMLEKPSMRGIKNSVVEKYSDQAHFIYELLQNADDAHATTARFILEPTRLIFAHNGTRQFSVSDPSNEDSDSETGKLGDINAITSIANSNKTEASIGKFGVGFKSVFQYTSTPHIYDSNFRFKIERFIVPIKLDEDFPMRYPDETLFVFPFDHPERDAVAAYEDISDKLKSLSFPLLFLSDLKNIEFEFSDVIGLYDKNIKKTYSFDDITAEHVCLTQNNGDDLYDENLWLFSRLDDYQRRYSVGFFLDKHGHLRPVNEPAFCFFPTKEVTGLNFIIHAPFLLTDSREGIRAGIPHNDKMVKLLADLAAKAILHLKEIGEKESLRLIGDDIVQIIPYDPKRFSDLDDKSKISFLPVYDSIQATLKKETIIPSIDGYVSSENAYWAAVPQLTQLFSNEQLRMICGNDLAGWAFPSIGRDEVRRVNEALRTYIDFLVKANLNEDVIIGGRSREYAYVRGIRQALENIKGITPAFIESQSIAWLHELYKWLSERDHRCESVQQKPIFLNQNGKAAAAFDKAGQPILFLPVENITDCAVVHSSLLENPDTKKFIKKIGIKPPSLRDQIYNSVLPLYEKGGAIDTDPHFKLFFEYYCNHCLNGDDDDFIELIEDYEFLTYYDVGDPQPYRGAASTMYLPTPELKAYFETKPEIRFIAIDEYRQLVGQAKDKQLISFLSELGIKKEIEVEVVPVNYQNSGRTDLPCPRSTRERTWEESVIVGCKEIVAYIVVNKDKAKSILLWNCLLSIIENKCSRYKSLSSLLCGTCRYFYYSPQQTSFISSDVLCLKQKAWLVNCDGEFVDASNVTRESLSEEYNTSSNEAQDLLDFLGITDMREVEDEEDNDSYLTDEQREKIEFAEKLEAMGIDESDLEELKRIKQQREASRLSPGQHVASSRADGIHTGIDNSDIDDLLDNIGSPTDEVSTDQGQQRRKLSQATSDVVKDIVRRTKESPAVLPLDEHTAEEEFDQDEYIPSPVDYSKRIEQAKQKSAAEIDKIAYIEELQKQAMTMPKYSFGWFKALLEMESLNSGEVNSNSKEVSISFAKVEREPGTKRTLVLKYPSRYIPQFMEDLADIPLVLHMGEIKKTIAIEVANIKSYTLRVKLKSGADIDGIDLTTVNAATIDAKNPVFLLEELRRQFVALNYADDFNMQENLCENIEFVFGPPGTGKTTHLAKNVLIPLMEENDKCKVLVLTPTNKAADVLARRIMEVLHGSHSYEDWLVRFGATADEEIEQSPVFKDKTFDIRTLPKNVTITTIARFPYDFFMPQGARLFLNGLKWDYIVIDEASMIPIANIVYPLYKKTPQKFIIAGDPFQIEPITSVDLWKNENIYTLVHLDSFVQPQTTPYQYKVELLTTQFRSIPEIGNIFSNFAYGGVLKHHRSSESQRPLNLHGDLAIKALNIIKFPVSKYESIYRAKRLQHSSSYQIYSALFTYEYICYLSKSIASANPGSLFKIGVIAPYRAQADLIDKLLAAEKMPNEVDVQVGTIHGFQGDECDIIFSVFNTPPTISASKEMFLNKRNIINVSISRARDYLFIIMPDDDTENISNLRLVKRVEQLVKSTNTWMELFTPDIELLMFGSSNYLENNAFSTSHQSVNVYGLPEKCYEVRTEDNAVDIQIHRGAPISVFKQTAVEETAVSFTDNSEDTGGTENPIPKKLRKDAIEIQVVGAKTGKYYLIPYSGKLKKYTDKKVISMFIPQIRSGKERLVSVSVVEDDRLIYISKDSFKTYEKGFTDSVTIELRKTYFG